MLDVVVFGDGRLSCKDDGAHLLLATHHPGPRKLRGGAFSLVSFVDGEAGSSNRPRVMWFQPITDCGVGVSLSLARGRT